MAKSTKLGGIVVYRFFDQPQLNTSKNSLTSSELIVFKNKDNRWKKCKNVNREILLNLVRSIGPYFRTKLPSVSINCSQNQFIDPLISDALISLQHQIFPLYLRVELTTNKSINRQINALVAQAENYRQHGIQISIDRADQITNLHVLMPLLEQTREIKFMIHKDTNPQLIKFWQIVTKKKHLRYIVYNVSTREENNILDNFTIPFRQGTYYGLGHELSM